MIGSGSPYHPTRSSGSFCNRSLFMVIERFKNGDAISVGERFRHSGRMLPDGVTYLASWVDLAGIRCFQVMEAPDAKTLSLWTGRWDDLVEFEIVPVQTSGDFWAKARPDNRADHTHQQN